VATLLASLRELKIYGVIAFIVVTVWIVAYSNSLEGRMAELVRRPTLDQSTPQTAIADLSE
jgi:hypothetical protein